MKRRLSNPSWKQILKQAGQGMTEYILLLVVIIAVAMLFRKQIQKAVGGKLDQVESQITGFGNE